MAYLNQGTLPQKGRLWTVDLLVKKVNSGIIAITLQISTRELLLKGKAQYV
jgi:hypothetical protein